MARSFIDPEVDDILEIVLDRANYEFEMKTHIIKEGDTNENKTLKNSDYRREGYIAIGFRKQNGEMIFSPKADFVIKKGMEVMLFGAGKKKKLI